MPKRAQLICGIALALASSSCVTTELVYRTPSTPLLRSSDAELVEVATSDGVVLRGLFHRSLEMDFATIAPVVLELSSGSASVATRVEPEYVDAGLPSECSELSWDHNVRRFDFVSRYLWFGYSVLRMDYRGIGASDGVASTSRLPDDAWAMWEEALRRANGDPSRVIVRARGVGTLAAASLIERGAQPGAVVLYAPVRAESVVEHALERNHGAFLAALVAPFVKPLELEVDLVAALAKVSGKLVVFTSERDEFLSPAERELVLRATRAARGTYVRLDADHAELCSAASELANEECFEIARYIRSSRTSLESGFCALRNPDTPVVRRAVVPFPLTEIKVGLGTTSIRK